MMGAQKLGQDLNPGGILVDSKGYIRLPLVGKTKIAGLTQSKASEKLEKKFSNWLNKPSVYVEALNKKVFILGEVKRQGVLRLDKDKITLFEALAYSGGLSDSAIRNGIVIISKAGNDMQMREIDLTNFEDLKNSNVTLNPNDIVYVKPNKWKRFKVESNNYLSPIGAVGTVLTPVSAFRSLSE